MQITFDPLNAAESAKVLEILNCPKLESVRSFADVAQSEIAREATQVATSAAPVPQPNAVNIVLPGVNAVHLEQSHAELDSAGFPWDHRIHASSKAKIVDGTWRKKREVDTALVEQVEAELRTLMHGKPVIPAAPTPVPVPVAVNAAPEPAPAVSDKQEFVKLVARTSTALSQKLITQEQVNTICANSGIANLMLLGNRLDLVPVVAFQIDELLK